MSKVPGYNPLTAGGGAVSYPATYQGVKTGGYSNPANPVSVPQGNVTFRAQPGAGGDGKRRSGKNFPKTLKVFTCANKHPIAALKELRADAQFEVICTYQTNSGAAIVVNTTIDGVVYQGEGTSGQIAKAIAAHKALMGMNAADHSQVKQVVDYEEQKKLVMDRISIWQDMQAKKESKKLEMEKALKEKAERKLLAAQNRAAKENEPKLANKKKKKNNGAASEVDETVQLDYGILIQKYGPDVSETTTQLEEKTEVGCFQFRCVLSVQGFTFESTGTSKRGARNQAVSLAHVAFATNPPPVVNEKKRKIPKKLRSEGGEDFKPIDPVEFQDKLAVKCWDFVTEQTAAIIPQLKIRRNLVVVVKVDGADQLENCEIVSFGNGTLTVKKENMTCDGNVIKDCTAESLALRAFRRYLLDQVELCLSGKSSVYIKDRAGGKCSIKKSVKFYLYTNSCPMGDCRAVGAQVPPQSMETNTPKTVEPEAKSEVKPELMETGDTPTKPVKPKTWVPNKTSKPEDLGKIRYFAMSSEFGSSETTDMYTEGKSHCIVSPSDKLAVRQVCGVQGSVLFSLSNPVYISHYFINRSFNETSVSRALHSRMKGANIPTGKDAPVQPQFTKVTWKATRMVEKRTKWALIWAKNHEVEILFTPQGKQYHKDKQEDVSSALKGDLTKYLAPSEYCTRALFTACVNVCKKSKKTYPQKYSVAKSANTRYRQLKTTLFTHFKDTGLGEWVPNPCKPDY